MAALSKTLAKAISALKSAVELGSEKLGPTDVERLKTALQLTNDVRHSVKFSKPLEFKVEPYQPARIYATSEEKKELLRLARGPKCTNHEFLGGTPQRSSK